MFLGAGLAVFTLGMELTAVGYISMDTKKPITEVMGAWVPVVTFCGIDSAVCGRDHVGAFAFDTGIEGDGEFVVAISVIETSWGLTICGDREVVQEDAHHEIGVDSDRVEAPPHLNILSCERR